MAFWNFIIRLYVILFLNILRWGRCVPTSTARWLLGDWSSDLCGSFTTGGCLCCILWIHRGLCYLHWTWLSKNRLHLQCFVRLLWQHQGYISTVEFSSDITCRLADYDLPSEVIRLDCSGSERNLNNCSIELLTNNTNCKDVPYLKCSELRILLPMTDFLKKSTPKNWR